MCFGFESLEALNFSATVRIPWLVSQTQITSSIRESGHKTPGPASTSLYIERFFGPPEPRPFPPLMSNIPESVWAVSFNVR